MISPLREREEKVMIGVISDRLVTEDVLEKEIF